MLLVLFAWERTVGKQDVCEVVLGLEARYVDMAREFLPQRKISWKFGKMI